MADFKPGDVIGGDYEVLAFIGAGGMGDVYKVRHKILDTQYALKCLHAQKVTPVAWKRFQTEAQAIARLSHPNIVAIYNLGIHDGFLPFYVMDILDGPSLQEILTRDGSIPLKKTLRIFIDACAGIAYAHKKGIVHRDIKPPNIVLLNTPDAAGARVKIVDFGIAKLTATTSGSESAEKQQLTQAGEVFGSPYYMSPEQCEGGIVDERSDIYSLGCTLFEALTGAPPFRGRSAVETMLMHQKERAPTLTSSRPIKLADSADDPGRTAQFSAESGKFPDMLEMVLATMLAKNPDSRYQNVERLIRDLRTIYAEEFSQPEAAQSVYGGKLIEEEEEDGVTNPKNFGRVKLIAISACAVGVLSLLGFMAISAYVSKAQNPIKASGQAVNPDSSSAPTKLDHPLSVLVTNDNRPYYAYDFPVTDEDFGYIVYSEQGKRKNIRCRGKFTVPASQLVAFTPGPGMSLHPDYFSLLDPDPIQIMDLEASFIGDPSGTKFDDSTVQKLLHFKNLNNLSISNIQTITDKSMASIAQLKNLRTVHIKTTNITAAAFSTLPILPDLHNLAFWGEDSITPVLERLAGSKVLTFLDLTRTKLSPADYRLIGTLKNLNVLICDGCSTGDDDIKALAGLHLAKLNVAGNQLTEAGKSMAKKIVTEGSKELTLSRNHGEHGFGHEHQEGHRGRHGDHGFHQHDDWRERNWTE